MNLFVLFLMLPFLSFATVCELSCEEATFDGKMIILKKQVKFCFPEKEDNANLQTQLSNETTKNLRCFYSQKKVVIDTDKKILIANSDPENPLSFQDAKRQMTAQDAQCRLQKPYSLLLENNVRCIDEPIKGFSSFAIADTLTYEPLTKKTVLSSVGDHSVLVKQEENQLTMAAKTIVIENHEAHGIGTVRLFFNFAENKLLSKIWP